MPSLSQSPLLQALGFAIAHSLWQMAIVWIVYVLLNGLIKFRSENKYRMAVAAQVVGFAWFLGTLQFYYAQSNAALQMAESVYLEGGEQSTMIVSSDSLLLRFFIRAEQVLPYLSMAYLALLVFLTFRWFTAYRYTQLVRNSGLQKIDVDWKLFVNKVAAQLGIKRKVRIYLSELVKSPVTIGFFKPLILVPVASVTHLTPEQLEAVILHELAHIRRHDYLLNIVLSVIDLALFFNPFTRLISRSVSRERENSCDDWVLQYQYSPAMYAEALIRIAVLQKTPALAMYAAKTKTELVSRIDRMVNQKDNRFSYRHQLIALLLMTGILSSIAWYDPNAMKVQENKPMAEKRAVVVEPLAAKIDNPLFNPVFFLNEPIKAEVKKNIAATEKQMRKLQQSNELAVREIQLPEVMAPVAIQNLKAFEQNINASVNHKMRKLWAPAAPRNLWTQSSRNPEVIQIPVFKFDSLQFNWPGATAIAPEINLQSLQQQLIASTKSVQDALRRRQISESEAKKMQAEIAAAFAQLKHARLPQLPGFAYVDANDDDQKEEDNTDLATDERRIGQESNVRRRTFAMRDRKLMMDSLRAQKKIRVANGAAVLPVPGVNTAFIPGQFQRFTTADSTFKKAFGAAAATGKLKHGNVYVYSYAAPDETATGTNNSGTHQGRARTVKAAPGCIIKTEKNGKIIEITVTTPAPPTPPAQVEDEEINND